MSRSRAIVFAGIPALNAALYHRIRFLVGDPTGYIELNDRGKTKSILILRDIEMGRAKQHAKADEVYCPADFSPEGGLSGDRATATAQALAECLKRHEVTEAVVDRTLPYIYAHEMQLAGIALCYDADLGVAQRRVKDEQEIAWLAEAQGVTEEVMLRACELVANAKANREGVLQYENKALTADRVRYEIDVYLLSKGYSTPTSIVAPGACGADCHEIGHGEIYTGQPVIIDIFPLNKKTLYNGDCTRTVVHGEVPQRVQAMHKAVVEAKAAATSVVRPGVTGEDVHRATMGVIEKHGFAMGLPKGNVEKGYCAMTHGTGHGIGLEVHEPPLLDMKGGALVKGDALTIEPGLYEEGLGGVRVEDMVVVTEDGCINFNKLPETLIWG